MTEQKPIIVNQDTLRFFLTEGVFKITQSFTGRPNNEENRNFITLLISNMLESFKEAGVMEDHKVVCDDTNNTKLCIDNNELAVSVAYKVRKEEQFMLNTFIATRTDTNFAEIEEDSEPSYYFKNRFKVVENYKENI